MMLPDTPDSLLSGRFSIHRVQQHWRGLVRPAELYEPHDAVLVNTDGSTAALISVLVRDRSMQHYIEHRLPVEYETVRSLRFACRARQRCVPLIMVVCDDDDFLLDLRDESGISVQKVSDDRTCLMYSGARFLPLFTLPSLL